MTERMRIPKEVENSPDQVVAELLTEMDLPVSAPAWTPQQASTFLRKLAEAGWTLTERIPKEEK